LADLASIVADIARGMQEALRKAANRFGRRVGGTLQEIRRVHRSDLDAVSEDAAKPVPETIPQI
jgi:hypothetical protein